MSPRTFSTDLYFPFALEAVWPLVRDTDIANKFVGNPPPTYRHVPQPDGTSRRFGRYWQGMVWEYEEEPYRWEYARSLQVERHYSRGPARHMRVELTLTGAEGGCRVHFAVTVTPRNVLAALGVGLITRGVVLRRFRRLFETWRGALSTGRPPRVLLDAAREEPADPATRARVAESVQGLAKAHPSPLCRRLEEALVTASPEQLHAMRPLRYARAWGASREEVIELFLAATRQGSLVMRWDVLCPHCRGSREELASLSELRERAYCEACNLHFDVDLFRTLEVVFAPHPAVRRSESRSYCMGGPGTSPHVAVQVMLAPGQSHTARVCLPEGRYRVRFSGAQESRMWDVVEGAGPGAATLTLTDEGLREGDALLASGQELQLTLANAAGRRALAVVETADWMQESLLAGELLVSPRFAHLFSSQALAPGVRLEVARVVVLFTDLVGSTALYRRLGDAQAFHFVWRHFDALRAVIEKEGGVLVKTIGDAVMAVFLEPAGALRAAGALHAAMEAPNREAGLTPPVGLRVGLAQGPAYVVSLNGRLDYFGSTVNLAARVQARSEGGDVVTLAALAEEAADALPDWSAETFSLEAKGFDAPMQAIRFSPSSQAASRVA